MAGVANESEAKGKTASDLREDLTAGEAAHVLGVEVSTLYFWKCIGRHTDKIGPYQFGRNGRYRYRRSELLEFRNQRATGKASE